MAISLDIGALHITVAAHEDRIYRC